MAHTLNHPPFDSFDIADWDNTDIQDLIRTTPLTYAEDGQPAGHDAEQLFGEDATDLLSRFR